MQCNGITIEATSGSHYQHYIGDSNTVDGKPLYYLIDEKDLDVPSDAGQIFLIESSHCTISDVSISNREYGDFQ